MNVVGDYKHAGQSHADVTEFKPGSVWFLQRLDLSAQYERMEQLPNGFLLQCHFFYDNLVELKPPQTWWVSCMILLAHWTDTGT